jgi:hypothetical protein
MPPPMFTPGSFGAPAPIQGPPPPPPMQGPPLPYGFPQPLPPPPNYAPYGSLTPGLAPGWVPPPPPAQSSVGGPVHTMPPASTWSPYEGMETPPGFYEQYTIIPPWAPIYGPNPGIQMYEDGSGRLISPLSLIAVPGFAPPPAPPPPGYSLPRDPSAPWTPEPPAMGGVFGSGLAPAPPAGPDFRAFLLSLILPPIQPHRAPEY